MSEETSATGNTVLSNTATAEIDHWVAKFPAEQKRSALLPALTIVQKENGGHLTTALMDAVAAYLDLPAIAVYEVATFYSMYDLEKVGRHKINVCTNISCKLRDSDQVVKHLEECLQIKLGETTADGKCTLREVECLGACIDAPMMQVDETYHAKLTPEKIDKILAELE